MGAVRRRRKENIAASAYAGDGGRCGDSYSWTRLSDRKLAVVVSDGTGKGEAAARESRRAVNAVTGLLKAGMDPELALAVLNVILTMDNRKERFPTVDLAILDYGTRELHIYKIGAAPTVIKRAMGRCGRWQDKNSSGRMDIYTAPAVPLGVRAGTEIPCVSTMVKPGDRIFMMTDGITDSDRTDSSLKWLRRLMERIKSGNLQTVCDLIIREAAANYGSREKDDMQVVSFVV